MSTVPAPHRRRRRVPPDRSFVARCGGYASNKFGEALWKTRKRLWTFSGKQVVHLLHIGKTGGTAVHEALDGHRRTSNSVILLDGHRIQLRHLPPGEKVVFFVRDPIARFTSGFYSRKRMGRPRFFGPWTEAEAAAFGRFDTPDALGLALDSDDENERLAAERAMRGIYHVRSSFWDWFGDEERFRDRIGDVLFVGRQERLAADFEKMKAILALPAHLALPADDVRSHRTPDGASRSLSEAAIAALKRWYRRDYDFIALCEDLNLLEPLDQR